jgi:hypothetical protein
MFALTQIYKCQIFARNSLGPVDPWRWRHHLPSQREEPLAHILERKYSETPPWWHQISHSLKIVSSSFPTCFALSAFCYSLSRKLHSLLIRSSVWSTNRSLNDRFSLHLFEWRARLPVCLPSLSAILLIIIRTISISVLKPLGGNVLKTGHSYWSCKVCTQIE